MKTYDKKEDLVLVINARPEDEAGIGDELGIMGVRDPGFRILTYEMSVKERCAIFPSAKLTRQRGAVQRWRAILRHKQDPRHRPVE